MCASNEPLLSWEALIEVVIRRGLSVTTGIEEANTVDP